MPVHSGQSKVCPFAAPVESPPVDTTVITPEAEQTNCVGLWLTMGEAMAAPKNNANHTSTRRVML